MAQKPSGEQWDYVWNYTDGMPEDNGATKVVSGSPTINMTPEGLEISTTSNHYVAYRYPDYQSNSGVIEVVFTASENLGTGNNLRAGYSDGEKGMQICTPSGIVAPYGRSTPSAELATNQINTIRVSLRSNKFWLNGEVVGEVNYYTDYSTNTQVMIQQSGGKIITLRSIRIRREQT